MIETFAAVFLFMIIPISIGWLAIGKPRPHHMLILAVFTLMAYLCWRAQSTYPAPLNWDLWEHQTAINAILSGKIALLPSYVSDTFGFNGYTTLFHILLAVPQYIFHPDILGFWWLGELYMAFLTGMAVYGLANAITRRADIALIAGILSAFSFESSVVFTPFFLMPQTAAALLWAYGMTWIIKSQKIHIWMLILFSLILISLHIIIGASGVLLSLWYLLSKKMYTDTPSKNLGFARLIIPFAVYGILWYVTKIVPMGTINYGEAASFMETLPEKLQQSTSWYGYLAIALLPMGIYMLRKSEPRDEHARIFGMFTIVMAVVASPIPYAMKFYIFGRYFLMVYMASGIFWLADKIPAISWKMAGVGMLLASQTIIFLANTRAWQKPLVFENQASHISTGELTMASALNHAYAGKDVMIASDPATSYILEPLSGINTPGGAYMSVKNREITAKLLTASSSAELKTMLGSLHDKIQTTPVSTYLFVVSGRYMQWTRLAPQEQQSFAVNIWQPQALTLADRTTIIEAEKTLDLKPVLQNDSAVIFAIPAQTL